MQIYGVNSTKSASGSVGKLDNSSSQSTDFGDVLHGKLQASTNLDSIFSAASEKYDVPVNLLKAVAKAESGFNPKATSSCGAMGVMQLMPGTAKALGVTDAYDPTQNIMGGAKYLSQMLSRFNGDTSKAVAAYNAGAGSVIKYGGVPPYSETQAYVKKVLSFSGLDLTAGVVSGSPSTADSTLSTSLTSALTDSVFSGTGEDDSKNLTLCRLMLSALLEMQMSGSNDVFSV